MKPGIGLLQQRLIGSFVVEWSNVEAALDDLIWTLLRLSMEDGRALTKRADAATKIAILRAIAPRHLRGPASDQFARLLQNADSIREDRNFVVHGQWGTLEPDGLPIAMSIRAKSKADEVVAESFPHDRLRQLIKRTRLMRDMLVRLRVELSRPGAGAESA